MSDPVLPPVPFTPETLAERWDCSPEHVRTLCKQGRLRSFKIGRGMYRIPIDAVAEFESPKTIETRNAPVQPSNAKQRNA